MLSIDQDRSLFREFGIDVQDSDLIVGADEAGRGPLAGPLFVAGVLFPSDLNSVLPELNDSKKLSEQKRNYLTPLIKKFALAYHIEEISLEIIDEINIYQASKLGMIRCFQKISEQVDVKFFQTDAMKISSYELPEAVVLPLVKGDQRSFHIAAASVLAKTARDELMIRLHEEFPHYEWDKNKGYPTKKHRDLIKEFGISPYHRKSFNLYGDENFRRG